MVVLRNKPIIIYDLETNGSKYLPIEHQFHHIVQISAMDINGIGLMNQYVTPRRYIPRPSIACHGITTEHATQNGKDIKHVLKDFIQKITKVKGNKPELYLVAHNNFGFDRIVLNKELKNAELTLPHGVIHIDTLQIYRKLHPKLPIFSKYGRSAYNLENLHHHFIGHKFQNAHDANSDVIALRQIVMKIIDIDVDINEKKIDTTARLSTLRNIGRYREQKLLQVVQHNTIQHAHNVFANKTIEETEQIIRETVGVNDDAQVLSILRSLHDNEYIQLSDLKGSHKGPLILCLIRSIRIEHPNVNPDVIHDMITSQFKSDSQIITTFVYECRMNYAIFQQHINWNVEISFIEAITKLVTDVSNGKTDHQKTQK